MLVDLALEVRSDGGAQPLARSFHTGAGAESHRGNRRGELRYGGFVINLLVWTVIGANHLIRHRGRFDPEKAHDEPGQNHRCDRYKAEHGRRKSRCELLPEEFIDEIVVARNCGTHNYAERSSDQKDMTGCPKMLGQIVGERIGALTNDPGFE